MVKNVFKYYYFMISCTVHLDYMIYYIYPHLNVFQKKKKKVSLLKFQLIVVIVYSKYITRQTCNILLLFHIITYDNIIFKVSV